MKAVYLVRHGQSVVNVSDHYGDESGPLTELGRRQAEAIGKRAKHLPIDVIVASSMTRARETADIIASHTGHPVETSDLFVERRIPERFYGLRKKSPEGRDQQSRWMEGFFRTGAPDTDENYESIFERARAALRYIEERPEEHILIATHGFFLRALISLVVLGEALTPETFRAFVRGTLTDHTGITVLQYGPTPYHDIDPDVDRWKLKIYNDHAHLG